VTHYIIARCDPTKLGATKLKKVLWFADVMYYRHHGRTITGVDNYVKRQFGPVQRTMLGVLDELKRHQKIAERPVETPVGICAIVVRHNVACHISPLTTPQKNSPRLLRLHASA
jgi:hypothetical protein